MSSARYSTKTSNCKRYSADWVLVHLNHELRIEIPYKKLSSDALEGLIEEYVSREGTDYGHRDISLEEKTAQVVNQLQHGEIVINYDAESGTTNLRQKNA